MELIKEIIESKLDESRQFIYGFADLRGLVKGKYADYPYGIVIGRRLDDAIIDTIVDGPTGAYYAYFKEINRLLSRLSTNIADEIREEGIATIPIEPTLHEKQVNKAYLKTLSVDISHKMLATRAGLGWIGKTALFISKKFGPRLRLVSILTNVPLAPLGKPVNESKCGNCDLCVEKCPAQAATNRLWQAGMPREKIFDAFKCRVTCKQLARERLNIDARVCGVCIAICPIGQRKQKKSII
jgi:epoxyqueuosine reductase QueG